MDHLWSPWRYRYVQKADPSDACIFCAKSQAGEDEKNLIVHRARYNFVILNLFPYTTGHLMVAPYEHVSLLEAASEEAAQEMMLLARRAQRLLRGVYHPHGFNIGMNLGESAGAGIAGHIHLHVLPRWTGDANFMTTIGETRVMPEDLAVTYEKLSEAFRTDSVSLKPKASEPGSLSGSFRWLRNNRAGSRK
jgi:ATP adenylyltransferase